MNYAEQVATVALIFGGAGCGLNVLSGFARRASLLSGAFMAVGAYTFAAYASGNDALLVASILAALGLIFVSILLFLSLEDDLFVLAGLAIQVVVTEVATNWTTLTNGPLGMSLQSIQLAPWPLAVAAIFFGCSFFLMAAIKRRALIEIEAANSVPLFAESCGRNVRLIKAFLIVASAVPAAVAGAIYAWYIGYFDPSTFDLNSSLLVLTILIVGGAGRLWAPLIGTAIVFAVPEALRLFDVSPSNVGDLRVVLYNVLLLTVLLGRSWWRTIAA